MPTEPGFSPAENERGTGVTDSDVPAGLIEDFTRVRDEFARMLLSYRFGMEELTTKVNILREEFAQLHSYNPIEHISTRLKTPRSIVNKATRKGVVPTIDNLRTHITDIAGLRVTCSFVADTYRVFDALTTQRDVEVLVAKDYIAHPKPNGYRSLHAIVQIPVFLSSGPVDVPVEVQIRTVAMDFWASLEHKIFYKYDGAIPPDVADRLTTAAATAAHLDDEMADLHHAVHGARDTTPIGEEDPASGLSPDVIRRLMAHLLPPGSSRGNDSRAGSAHDGDSQPSAD